MITVTPTQDYKLVKEIITTPELYQATKDDGACDPDLYEPNQEWLHLLAKNDDEIIGIVQFHAINSICLQGHINILPKHWGKRFDEVASLSLKLLKEYTTCLKVIAMVPEECKQVLEASKRYGFKEEGFISKSIMRNNILQGQHIVGIELASI